MLVHIAMGGFETLYHHDLTGRLAGVLPRRLDRACMALAQGVRTTIRRIGLALDRNGGILRRMLIPFEFRLGGPFGAGRERMSWSHRDDLGRMIVQAIATPVLSRAVNAVAPSPAASAIPHAQSGPAGSAAAVKKAKP